MTTRLGVVSIVVGELISLDSFSKGIPESAFDRQI